MRFYYLVMMLCISLPVHAGGTSWQIDIQSFERISDTEAKATITTLNETRSFNDCSKIHLLFDFDLDTINSTHIQKFVSKSSQVESLNDIETRSLHSKPVMILGSMGRGFRHVGSCKFQSMGLGLVTEYDGRKVIYSFHDSI